MAATKQKKKRGKRSISQSLARENATTGQSCALERVRDGRRAQVPRLRVHDCRRMRMHSRDSRAFQCTRRCTLRGAAPRAHKTAAGHSGRRVSFKLRYLQLTEALKEETTVKIWKNRFFLFLHFLKNVRFKNALSKFYKEIREIYGAMVFSVKWWQARD